jgi:hypothetical protein
MPATLHVERLAGLQAHPVGLSVLQSICRHKPTTAALQHFSSEVQRHVPDLSETQVVILRRKREYPLHLRYPPGVYAPPPRQL